jgi:signal transduction histidine kinase/DNA-binding response OmpR family regulator
MQPPAHTVQPKHLQVLVVEDSENDTLLLEIELQRAGFEPRCFRVETPDAMSQALQRQHWDLVVADYVMPRFNGLAALALVKEQGLDLPFIIVSGHITDDTAVAAMKAGAHDYVMKSNLARLGPAVRRELREAEVRHEQQRAEERLKAEHAITRVLSSAQSFEEVAPNIAQILLDSFQLDLLFIWLIGPDGIPSSPAVTSNEEFLRVAVSKSRVESSPLQTFLAQRQQLVLQPGVSFPGSAWLEHRVIWTEDLSERADPKILQPAFPSELRGAMAFPIEGSASFFGVLEFFTTQKLQFEATLSNSISAIGSELGQFIQRRRAEEALRRAHDELELRVQQRTAELRTANAKLHTAISERKRLEHELLEITEKERRRIGLDLHDDLGQKLSGIALMTKGLELKLAKQHADEASDAGKIHSLVQQAMNHASDLAHDLATLDLKDNDLTAALRQLAVHASELFGITCQFKANGQIPPLEPQALTQLYKITQEAVTNAIKHGKARKVSIGLSNGSDKLLLTVQNNGLPFPDLKGHSTGMGLRIMNYRASLIGGSLEVKGTGSRGTLVTCSIPLDKK